MTTGDTSDMLARLRSLLPPWFGTTTTPVLNAVLTGFASVSSAVYSLISYVTPQTRIATATDGWLDLIGLDFFGRTLKRFTNETDNTYRARLLTEITLPRGTVASIKKVLTALTGRAPKVFEPSRPCNGGYGIACGYGSAGAYGSENYPGQVFVIAYRPQVSYGVPNVAGYGSSSGGYGVGSIEYVSAGNQTGTADDTAILAAVERVRPAGVVAWVDIQS